jgi:hypothetical protein
MNDYRIRFTATSGAALETDAASRLAVALEAMPGANGVEETTQNDRRIAAVFWIQVRLGMADAARDGSRLAKEGLKVAGLGDAQLVELAVSMEPRPRLVGGATGS